MNSHWTVMLVGLSVLTIASPSIATTYTSPSGSTTLVLRERTTSPSGFYFTNFQGQEWMGQIQIDTAGGAMGDSYTGTFRDSTIGPGQQKTCIGNIEIVRQSIGRGVGAEVTWNVTEGTDCPLVGQTMNVTLEEALPRPNTTGEFTDISTYMSETNGEVDWPKWRVVSPDGTLNCRETPNGKVQRSYSSGTEIEVDGRAVGALRMTPSGPWLLTRQGCYVRANSRYIEPVSLPE